MCSGSKLLAVGPAERNRAAPLVHPIAFVSEFHNRQGTKSVVEHSGKLTEDRCSRIRVQRSGTLPMELSQSDSPVDSHMAKEPKRTAAAALPQRDSQAPKGYSGTDRLGCRVAQDTVAQDTVAQDTAAQHMAVQSKAVLDKID
jgi:hypothetical protein